MCRINQNPIELCNEPENVAYSIALDQCTECHDIIWANEEWFTYKINQFDFEIGLCSTEKRIHRSCLGDILAARLADPE